MHTPPRMVEVRARILKENDLIARLLRERFERAGVCVVSLIGSPGSGKTMLLERLLAELGSRYRVAAVTGDPSTDRDAERLGRVCAAVRQITTGTACNLDAKMICGSLCSWRLEDYDFLFIENVGNLVCPAGYDLGESLRVVLLSSSEGEGTPLKYPGVYNTADITVITKTDLADACGFDTRFALGALQHLRPGMPVLETSASTGKGIAALVARLEDARHAIGAEYAHAHEVLT